MTTADAAQQFSDALVSEIKAEMGRQDLSSRALGRLIDKTSQYMSDRLDGGNSKTGKRVILTVRDLSAIAHALRLSEVELVERAQRVVNAHLLAPRELTIDDIDHVETPNVDDYDLAAKRGERAADRLPYAE